ncbi:steryl-sulfatase [Exaiptasia diaphana]|uniref:Sulfatase N-terminal domain-containing protein n=1 Tax=Exaiptasia diaphana TaxID=2652724 RepID=A0A913Y1R4_EXADI|nr:steryl-sulfatase [Exaiptasia diaphana]KXJ23535.1 Steryl-sulfatase [Exaiptasia diaphana]
MSWLVLALVAFSGVTCHAQSKPNFVLFLVDDLGIGDIGCFGNKTIKTPNVDRLAAEGARLDHNLAPESVCTPSRAAFVTGRYPIRSGLASNPDQHRMFLYLSAPGGLPQNETTFAEVLQDVGYSTAMVGKWHLGLNDKKSDDYHFHPMRHGFQHFYGLPLTNLRECEIGGSNLVELVFPRLRGNLMYSLLFASLTGILCCSFGLISKRSAIMLCLLAGLGFAGLRLLMKLRTHGTCILMRDYEIVEQPVLLENLTARFTDYAIDFIEQNQQKPFVLFMSYAKVHTALFTTKPFEGHSVHGRYGDNVEEMDWSVGEIMKALDKLGLKKNTFAYFTSDQGPHLEESLYGEYQGGWRGIYTGGKGQSWEGGIRVPTVVSWPARIPKGISISEPTNSLDVFPTIAHIAGAPIPNDRIIDGKDLMPLLTQQQKVSPHEFMFHYCAKEIHAVRYRPRDGKTTWKAHFKTPKWIDGTQVCYGLCLCYEGFSVDQNPPLLYDITTDPTESHPLDPNDKVYKKVLQSINKAVDDHTRSIDEVPNQLDNNNWWRGGFSGVQPCCNPPFCSCSEDGKTKHYPEV